MSDITVTTAGDRVAVASPYNADLVAGARALAGKFDAASKRWTFDARDEQRVRDLLISVYGTDGSAVAETVTVRLALASHSYTADGYRHDNGEIIFAGRRLASRPARDSAVRLTGAVVAAGGFAPRGGSVRNPALEVLPGTILEVRDVPAGHPDIAKPGVTIINTTIDRDALAAERATLVARLAEIDALLA